MFNARLLALLVAALDMADVPPAMLLDLKIGDDGAVMVTVPAEYPIDKVAKVIERLDVHGQTYRKSDGFDSYDDDILDEVVDVHSFYPG